MRILSTTITLHSAIKNKKLEDIANYYRYVPYMKTKKEQRIVLSINDIYNYLKID